LALSYSEGREEIMEKKEAMLVDVSKRHEDMEGAHRAIGISSCARIGDLIGLSVVPDSEAPEKMVFGWFLIESEGIIQSFDIPGVSVGRDVSELLRLLRAFQQHQKTGELIPCGGQPGKTYVTQRRRG